MAVGGRRSRCREREEEKVPILPLTGLQLGTWAASSRGLLRVQELEVRKKTLWDNGLWLFCMRHSADAQCFSKGSSTKPACKVPECKESQVESLHDIMTEEMFTVNTVEYDEDEEEEEEGFLNMAKGEYGRENDEGWRIPR
jgi:hypothetical protein